MKKRSIVLCAFFVAGLLNFSSSKLVAMEEDDELIEDGRDVDELMENLASRISTIEGDRHHAAIGRVFARIDRCLKKIKNCAKISKKIAAGILVFAIFAVVPYICTNILSDGKLEEVRKVIFKRLSECGSCLRVCNQGFTDSEYLFTCFEMCIHQLRKQLGENLEKI